MSDGVEIMVDKELTGVFPNNFHNMSLCNRFLQTLDTQLEVTDVCIPCIAIVYLLHS